MKSNYNKVLLSLGFSLITELLVIIGLPAVIAGLIIKAQQPQGWIKILIFLGAITLSALVVGLRFNTLKKTVNARLTDAIRRTDSIQ